MNTPSVDINLYGPEMAEDPWPILRQIRELGPLVWNERGQWITAHDRVCRQIINRPLEATMKGVMTSTFGEGAFITMDDKQSHNALRNVWVSAFGTRGVASLVAFTRQTIEARLDEALALLESQRHGRHAAGVLPPDPGLCHRAHDGRGRGHDPDHRRMVGPHGHRHIERPSDRLCERFLLAARGESPRRPCPNSCSIRCTIAAPIGATISSAGSSIRTSRRPRPTSRWS